MTPGQATHDFNSIKMENVIICNTGSCDKDGLNGMNWYNFNLDAVMADLRSIHSSSSQPRSVSSSRSQARPRPHPLSRSRPGKGSGEKLGHTTVSPRSTYVSNPLLLSTEPPEVYFSRIFN